MTSSYQETQYMRMTLAQLEAFFWVAQLGSVQLAARQLNLAQPTISLRIRELEQSLGRELLDRRGRGVRPNDAGLNLVERIAAILREVGKIRAQTVADFAGPIRIGFAEGFAMVCLPPLMNALRRDYPALRPEYVVTTSSSLERDMSAHRLDLAFLVNPVGQPGVRLMPMGGQPTVWTAAAAMDLGPRVRPADLRSMPIITNPPPSAMHRQIMAWFATAGIEPSRLDMCSSVTMVAHLVASGVGVGLLPLKMIEPQIAARALVALQGIPAVEHGRVFAAFWEEGHTPAIEAVIHCTRTVLGGMDYLVTEGSAS